MQQTKVYVYILIGNIYSVYGINTYGSEYDSTNKEMKLKVDADDYKKDLKSNKNECPKF